MNLKKNFKIFSLILSLVMVFSITGCKTEKLDQAPGENQTSAVPETTVAMPSETVPQSTEETTEEYFDMDDISSDNQDLSKYDEKDVVVHKDKDGNVLISDGNQNGQDKYETDAVPEGQQLPVEPGELEIDKSSQKTCYLTISCTTILDNMGDLEPGKEVLVPSDGILLARTAIPFYEGESVFDILQRETRNRRIHMSSRFTPMYNSAYIEAIGNLYEFDCGANSGWMYNVNGWYPNYGVSRYVVQDGDTIELNYTCDLGRDLSGGDWME